MTSTIPTLNETVEARAPARAGAQGEGSPVESQNTSTQQPPPSDDLAAALERGADPDDVLDRLERFEHQLSDDAHRELRTRVLDVADRWTQARRVQEALPLLEGYRDRYVHDGRAALLLGDVYQIVGRADAAFPVLFDVVAYPADAKEAQQARDRIDLLERANAALLVQRRDNEGLVSLYQKLFTLYPLNDQYRVALAQWQIESGEFAAATETLAQVADPDERASRLAERASLATTGVPVHTSGDQLLADVAIGGVQLTLLVDTGATHTSLEVGTLRRIAAERLHDAVSVRTAAGVVDLPLYRVADVTLGALEVPTLDVLELDADLPGVQ